MEAEAVAPALPSGELIAVCLHLSVPVDHEGDEIFLRRCFLDLDGMNIVEVPQRLREQVLVPANESRMAADCIGPRELDVHVPVVEMAQVEVGRRSVLEMREPVVEKAPQVVGRRWDDAVLRLESHYSGLVLGNGSCVSSHWFCPLSSGLCLASCLTEGFTWHLLRTGRGAARDSSANFFTLQGATRTRP